MRDTGMTRDLQGHRTVFQCYTQKSNIEKLGMGLGTRLMNMRSLVRVQNFTTPLLTDTSNFSDHFQ